MSLSNFQLNLLLEELDRRMKPLKDAMDEPNPSLTQMAMLNAAHDSGKLLGMLQTKYLIVEMMREDERKRQIELDQLRNLHGLKQEYLNHQAHHPPVNWEEAIAMIKDSQRKPVVALDMTTAMDAHSRPGESALDHFNRLKGYVEGRYTIQRCHIHGDETFNGQCPKCKDDPMECGDASCGG